MNLKLRNTRKEKNNTAGITLIALVVTIVVLLILAGVSINLVLGDNGIITKAKETKIEQAHAQVKDAMALIYGDYQIEMLTAKENGTREIAKLASLKVASATARPENVSFLAYLISNEITDQDGVVNVQKLLGSKLDFGNGTGNSDVYKVENASGNYKLTYYDKEGKGTEIDTYGGDIASDPVDKTALKFLVNSGEDGIVVLPIAKYNDMENEVDWGDGTTGSDETVISTIKTELASLDGIKVAAAYPNGMAHIYSESNKEFVVTVKGECHFIGVWCEGVTKDKIIEVLQWGETGLDEIYLYDCPNLRKIASPTENSFSNMTNFDLAFENCTSLTSIPADLFENCPAVTSFLKTFAGCSGLTGIPTNLFANCPSVTCFESTFTNCSGLTGNAPDLWNRVQDGETNWYVGTPNGLNCFYGCTGLLNYENIPEYWKNVED